MQAVILPNLILGYLGPVPDSTLSAAGAQRARIEDVTSRIWERESPETTQAAKPIAIVIVNVNSNTVIFKEKVQSKFSNWLGGTCYRPFQREQPMSIHSSIHP